MNPPVDAPDVDRVPAVHVDRERVEPGGELVTAARDVRGTLGGEQRDRFSPVDLAGRRSTRARRRRAPGPRRSPPRPASGWARGRAARARRRASAARGRQPAFGADLGAAFFFVGAVFLAGPAFFASRFARVSRRSSAFEVGPGRETERAELALHLVLHDLAQVVAAAPAHLDDLVDRRAHLIAGEMALRDEVGDDGAGLRTPQLGELHAGLEHALPVGVRRHRWRESSGILGGMVGPLHAGARGTQNGRSDGKPTA